MILYFCCLAFKHNTLPISTLIQNMFQQSENSILFRLSASMWVCIRPPQIIPKYLFLLINHDMQIQKNVYLYICHQFTTLMKSSVAQLGSNLMMCGQQIPRRHYSPFKSNNWCMYDRYTIGCWLLPQATYPVCACSPKQVMEKNMFLCFPSCAITVP